MTLGNNLLDFRSLVVHDLYIRLTDCDDILGFAFNENDVTFRDLHCRNDEEQLRTHVETEIGDIGQALLLVVVGSINVVRTLDGNIAVHCQSAHSRLDLTEETVKKFT